LVATGVWVTGVWLLAWTMWRRFRRGQSLDAGFLAARFSDVATWALIAVTVSGLALSWAILRSPDHLWSTDFGRLLTLKVILVAIIGGLGLHHRRVLVPELAAGVPDAAPRLRRTLVVESGLFMVVLLLTALLVAASPTG
ncbi:MAG: CopD family protein, partial [Ilumatobacteraceae bacterium]